MEVEAHSAKRFQYNKNPKMMKRIIIALFLTLIIVLPYEGCKSRKKTSEEKRIAVDKRTLDVKTDGQKSIFDSLTNWINQGNINFEYTEEETTLTKPKKDFVEDDCVFLTAPKWNIDTALLAVGIIKRTDADNPHRQVITYTQGGHLITDYYNNGKLKRFVNPKSDSMYHSKKVGIKYSLQSTQAYKSQLHKEDSSLKIDQYLTSENRILVEARKSNKDIDTSVWNAIPLKNILVGVLILLLIIFFYKPKSKNSK